MKCLKPRLVAQLETVKCYFAPGDTNVGIRPRARMTTERELNCRLFGHTMGWPLYFRRLIPQQLRQACVAVGVNVIAAVVIV